MGYKKKPTERVCFYCKKMVHIAKFADVLIQHQCPHGFDCVFTESKCPECKKIRESNEYSEIT